MSNQITPAAALKQSISQMRAEFEKALPPHIKVDKFIRVLQTAVGSNQELLKCDRTSLLAACAKAAEIGLYPNGTEAAIVPFKGQAKFMSMIAGKLKLARNSGEIKSVDAQIVHKNDSFRYWIDENGPHLNHEPNLMISRGDIIGAYATGQTKDGGTYIEFMTNDQIKDIENTSRGNNTPWKGPFRAEMIKKSVLNRLLKRMPTSTDIDHDSDNDYLFSEPEAMNQPPQPELEKEVIPKDATKPNQLSAMIADETTEVPI